MTTSRWTEPRAAFDGSRSENRETDQPGVAANHTEETPQDSDSRAPHSPQLDDSLAGRECLGDRGPATLKHRDQRLSAAIADSDPEEPAAIARAIGEMEEVEVLRHNDATLGSRAVPDGTVARRFQAKIEDVNCVGTGSG